MSRRRRPAPARPAGTSSNSPRRKSSSPAPVAQESAVHAQDPLVLDVERRRLGKQVDLVQDDDLRPLVEAGAVGAQLAVDRPPSRSSTSSPETSIMWTSTRARSRCARNSCPSPTPSLAPSISPGTSATVSCRAVGRVDGAEHRLQRRERVVRDLRPRVGDAREERRLARVRQADERRVGEQLEPQLELERLAGQAGLREARRLPRRRREVAVAPPAAAARATTTRGRSVREVGDRARRRRRKPASRPEPRAPRSSRRRRACPSRRRPRRCAP